MVTVVAGWLGDGSFGGMVDGHVEVCPGFERVNGEDKVAEAGNILPVPRRTPSIGREAGKEIALVTVKRSVRMTGSLSWTHDRDRREHSVGWPPTPRPAPPHRR